MIALLFDAKTGESKDVTPQPGSIITFPELQKMLGGNIEVMFSDLFENQIVVMNKFCYDSSKGLPRNEEMTGVFPVPIYGNVLICEEKILPFKSWETYFVTLDSMMFHAFGNNVQVSYNFNTGERKLVKNGKCIDSMICDEHYTLDEHTKYLSRLMVDVGKMDSLNH